MILRSTSGILYVRASVKPFARALRSAGSLPAFLRERFAFEELFAPWFTGARAFWKSPRGLAGTNSGALGRIVSALPGSVASAHATHRFAGVGEHVAAALAAHAPASACFGPIAELATSHDFSMLLLACVEESPGFSTVHAVQEELGLTRMHLIRFALRWDIPDGSRSRSIIAPESPGCSRSFGKFYAAYAADNNLVEGELFGQRFLFVQSARHAMDTERSILSREPQFVDCGRWNCETCRLRWY